MRNFLLNFLYKLSIFYDIVFVCVELVLELIKNDSVSESENAQACIGFSTAFAMDFNIYVSTNSSSNETVDDNSSSNETDDGIGECSLLKLRYFSW